jgi:uncharacterized protein
MTRRKTKIPTTGADLDRLETWVEYRVGLCRDCRATCCTMPVEVRMTDLIRTGVVDELEAQEPTKAIAKRLKQAGVVERYNVKTGIFSLARLANSDCIYLHPRTRLCTIYAQRPDTCRNHPGIGPRPGFCAYQPRAKP